MSMMSLEAIERKIQDTKQQITAFEMLESSDFAKFQIEELRRRLEALNAEKTGIIESQAKEFVSLRVYGETIERGRISNRILISMLDGFQTMVDNIANVMVGANGSRGQVTDRVKKVSDFEVCGIFEGSFGIRLEKNYNQLELTHESLETDGVLQEFFAILENSTDSEKLIEKISPYGQRTVKNYRKWLKNLKENAVNIEIDWISEINEKRRMNVRYAKSDDIIYTLDSISDIQDENIDMVATVTGINIRKNTFELRTEENEIIKGKSRIETLIKASNRIGNEVVANLVKSTSESSVCGTKESWFLSDIIDK